MITKEKDKEEVEMGKLEIKGNKCPVNVLIVDRSKFVQISRCTTFFVGRSLLFHVQFDHSTSKYEMPVDAIFGCTGQQSMLLSVVTRPLSNSSH